jgi:hypothetical protein
MISKLEIFIGLTIFNIVAIFLLSTIPIGFDQTNPHDLGNTDTGVTQITLLNNLEGLGSLSGIFALMVILWLYLLISLFIDLVNPVSRTP